MIGKSNSIQLTTALSLLALVLVTACAIDPVVPHPPPKISEFSADPPDITPGDSSLITYRVAYADSVKFFPGGSIVTPAGEGSFYVFPPAPTDYSLVAYNNVGKDSAGLSIAMSTVAPQITRFELTEDTILIGDQTILTWKTFLADSIVIDGVSKYTTDSGQVSFDLQGSATITGIAYNDIATDTAAAGLIVEVPHMLEPVNGLYCKGEMGGGVQSPPMEFHVVDDTGGVLTRPWIHFSCIEGDGLLTADSVQPGGDGIASVDYEFSGGLGHAVIGALVREVDTVQMQARASTIIPGQSGQGQYVLLEDTYSDVKNFNGQPERVDYVAFQELNYAVYEQSLGVVVMVEDTAFPPGTAQDHEPVHGVILTENFTGGRTAEDVGIGSPIDSVRFFYGIPDTTYLDTVAPPAQLLRYFSLGLDFYTHITGDSAVMELHVLHPAAPSPVERKLPLRRFLR